MTDLVAVAKELQDSISAMIKILITLILLSFIFACGSPQTQLSDAQKGSSVSNFEPINKPLPTAGDNKGLQSSSILDKIRAYKKANINITVKDLADYGNALLPTNGIDFDIDFGRVIKKKTAAKLTKPMKIEGDDGLYVTFPLELQTETGVRKVITVKAPGDESCCCGYYYTPIPVTQISRQRLTILIEGKPYVISRNRDFPVVQEYILYENLKNPKRIRSWEVPFETYPYGLSQDGLNLYIDLETDDLLLEISSEGNLRFIAKGSDGILNNGEDLRKITPPKEGEILHKSGEFGLMQYKRENKDYVVEFPYPCT